jgi:hypothetical protein
MCERNTEQQQQHGEVVAVAKSDSNWFSRLSPPDSLYAGKRKIWLQNAARPCFALEKEAAYKLSLYQQLWQRNVADSSRSGEEENGKTCGQSL